MYRTRLTAPRIGLVVFLLSVTFVLLASLTSGKTGFSQNASAISGTAAGVYAPAEPHDRPNCGPSLDDLNAVCEYFRLKAPGKDNESAPVGASRALSVSATPVVTQTPVVTSIITSTRPAPSPTAPAPSPTAPAPSPTTPTPSPTMPGAGGDIVYYVDATRGNDANDGTSPERAWRSLERVYSAFEDGWFKGGDAILFRRGERWTATDVGRLRVRHVAGTSEAAPLYIGAYGVGPRPRLDGGGALWTYILGSGLDDPPVSHVVVEGLEITGSHAQQIGLDHGVTHWTLRDLKVNEAGRSYGNALIIRRSAYITVDSCEMTTQGTSEPRSIIYIGTAREMSDKPHAITITGCNLYGSTEEVIDIKGGAHDVQIVGNTLTGARNEVISLRGREHVVRGNVISNPSGPYGIAGWVKGNGHVIEGNTFMDISGPAIRMDGNRHVIRDNLFFRCADACIRVAGNAWTMHGNELRDAPVGIYVSDAAALPDTDYNRYVNVVSPLDLPGRGELQSIQAACRNHNIECHSTVIAQ